MSNRQQPSFEYIEENSKKKYIIIGLGGLILIVGGAVFFIFGSGEKNSNTPVPAPQPQQVQVVAKDPAKQAEVDKQVEELRNFVQNPTSDDAVITVGWLGSKFNQPPEVIVRDIKILTQRLSVLSDDELAVFFNSTENPWNDSDSYNSLIKLISYRDYVAFISKCADRYERELLVPKN